MFQYVSIISVSTIPSRILFPRFTFQYVSIISFCFCFAVFNYIVFTFQYVSIISIVNPSGNRTYKKIYIPICFYYFKNESCNAITVRSFTFQYVSIISVLGGMISGLASTFTFQYVSIISS